MHAIFAGLILFASILVHADTSTELKFDQAEADYYNSLQAKCGDNLLCYYSAEEVESALGITPTEALVRGMLDENATEAYEPEVLVKPVADAARTSLKEDTDFSASRRSHHSGSHHRYSRRGRGGGGSDAGVRHALVGAHQSSGQIWGAFISVLHSCSPGCVPQDYNCYRGDSSSCHSKGRAVDVGAISCGGHVHYAIDGGAFASLVSCAEHHGLHVLYMESHGRGLTQDHHNHGHFSLGCGHGMY